ncbi:MAG TPA: ferritin-like domain-containing protein [Polyangiaceae bacterium]|nr:ferritin-like domain-containing protein [Polyangiaceae bacterium]
MQIRRVLTNTPLARVHERTILQRGPRKGVAVPWSSFRADRYPAAALALSYDAQRMLALGEYSAVSLFARFVEGLTRAGAPFDLVSAAARVPSDEIRHADLAFRFAALCAGREVSVEAGEQHTSSRFDRPMALDELDTFAIEVVAIGETLACALLSACLDGATDPVAHAVYSNIVADEVHHARLGWYYLLWRAAQWSLEQRQRVADHAGAMVVQVETRFGTGRDAPRGAQKAARALGVLNTTRQRRVVADVMKHEIVPGLDGLGLGASHAWRARKRIG